MSEDTPQEHTPSPAAQEDQPSAWTLTSRRGALLRGAALFAPALMFALVGVRVCDRELTSTPDQLDPSIRQGVYDPVGYDELVNRDVAPYLALCPLDPSALVELGSERVASEDDEAEEVVAQGCQACDTLRVSALFCLNPTTPAPHQERVRDFIRLSPLRLDLEDVRRWRRIVDARGRASVRLVTGLRRQSLPAAPLPNRYQGRLLYRDSSTVEALVDAVGNEYVFASSAAASEKPQAVSVNTLLENQRRVLASKAPQRVTLDGRRLTLTHGRGESINVLLPGSETAHAIVDLPMRAPGARSTLEVTLDGVPIETSSYRRMVGLARNQELQLTVHPRQGPPQTVSLRLVRRQSALLSDVWRGAESSTRAHDPTAGMERYLDTLVYGVEDATASLLEAYQQCGRSWEDVGALLHTDLRTTLDERLQHLATRGLHTYATRGPVARGAEVRFHTRGTLEGLWSQRTARREHVVMPPTLTLTVMDADTGELLALGAYPTPRALDQMRRDAESVRGDQPVDLLRTDLEAARRAGSLHLRPHVIGSIFKPLMAWGAGRADAQLLDTTLPLPHPETWAVRADGVSNGMLDQCLISSRMDDGKPYFSADRFPSPAGVQGYGCTPDSPANREDLCQAISTSDTYYFLKLGARLIARHRGRPLSSADEDLNALCGPQWLKPPQGGRHKLCGDPISVPRREWFPVTCAARDASPWCVLAELYGIQLQSIGDQNVVTTGAHLLGPLWSRLDGLGGAIEGECKAGVERWRGERLMGLRWAIHQPTQWPTDLMRDCTDLTAMIQGGHINYWNNLSLTQALARLFTGKRVHARLLDAALPQRAEGDASKPAKDPGTSAKPPAVEVIDALECEQGSSPRCKVLQGMRLAVERGTLRALKATERKLNAEPAARHATITLRGKTGTGRDLHPSYRKRRRQPNEPPVWERYRDRTRKSLHTALLVDIAHPTDGRRRRFVVYIWVEGVDAARISTDGAAPFFTPTQPGAEVLRTLRDLTLAGWQITPGATP